MKVNEEKAWFLTNDEDCGLIIGNNNGLRQLRSGIDKALECNDSNMLDYLTDTNIYGVILRNKADHMKLIQESKISLWDKLLKLIVAFWFIVMPFIAVVFILVSVFSEANKKEKLSVQPLINAIKKDCENKL